MKDEIQNFEDLDFLINNTVDELNISINSDLIFLNSIVLNDERKIIIDGNNKIFTSDFPFFNCILCNLKLKNIIFCSNNEEIIILENGKLIIESCRFRNSAKKNYIKINNTDNFLIKNCEFEYNYRANIIINNNIENCEISDCKFKTKDHILDANISKT